MKMVLKNIKPIALVILCISAYCSVLKAQVEYKTKNYTHELAPLKVSVSFLNMEDILTPITAGILVEGQLKDKLFYNVQIRKGYLRNFNIQAKDLLTTKNENKGTVFEADIDFPFSDITKSGKVKVITSTTFDGTYLGEKYFKANAEIRSYWALSGGVTNYSRPKYLKSDDSEYFGSVVQASTDTESKFIPFNIVTSGLYAGIVHRKIRKAIVTTNGTSYRRFYSKKFFAQFLVGSTSVKDFVYNDQTYKIANAKQVPFGYRLGWQWDNMGVVTGFEFGKLPGVTYETNVEKDELSKIFINNPFLNYARFTFHFNVFNADKNYHMKGR
ncbi:MAG: hypothetical protein JWN56_819 [Sphingobacteriales bacterium]|nr:hypothetical protein [Sphingobacteriales bacterium]